jgi:Ca2+-binding RTX toxin-like protein
MGTIASDQVTVTGETITGISRHENAPAGQLWEAVTGLNLDYATFRNSPNKLAMVAGNDSMAGNNQTNVVEDIRGYADDDQIDGRAGANKPSGGDGNDYLTATGSAGSNVAFGDDGNDLFGANGANDYLAASGNSTYFDPGSGNDAMLAAAGHSGDLFIFHPGYGRDEITGFTAHIVAGGSDVIDLRGYGLTFANLINTYTNQIGTDAVITLGGDTLTLHNVQKSGPQASDFPLVWASRRN